MPVGKDRSFRTSAADAGGDDALLPEETGPVANGGPMPGGGGVIVWPPGVVVAAWLPGAGSAEPGTSIRGASIVWRASLGGGAAASGGRLTVT
jgi:hypothetical protein